MGILQRAKDILSANVNALFDSWEDPAKMVDQYLRNMTSDLAEVKQETAGVMAQEKAAKRALDENQASIDKYQQAAGNALRAGNEEDARTIIAKKQEFEALRVSLQETYDAAEKNAKMMRELHDKLVSDIEQLNMRRNSIKAKAAVAKTQKKVNSIGSAGDKYQGNMSKFEELERKVDQQLDKELSVAELANASLDQTVDLVAQYSTENTTVDDEIERLKKEMGI